MQKVFIIALLVYFVSGTLLLPQGDFSILADLPRMYQHCKETEDPDMDLPDFIIEHLLNIDEEADEIPDPAEHEKPHQPVQFNHISSVFTITTKQFAIKIEQPVAARKVKIIVADDNYLSDYPSSVFSPADHRISFTAHDADYIVCSYSIFLISNHKNEKHTDSMCYSYAMHHKN